MFRIILKIVSSIENYKTKIWRTFQESTVICFRIKTI